MTNTTVVNKPLPEYWKRKFMETPGTITVEPNDPTDRLRTCARAAFFIAAISWMGLFSAFFFIRHVARVCHG